ncbi:nuclear transport factor 2 family protein [Paraburkholderia sp. HP33-1]|uniref:nuclear transport factor 2 family protein n=1 Tax=Paraburkholderia sp. HP33-1 TaxID=2883243 RepID=UPI001F437BF9|nr:nuclear transport factor 2 family protein [Paraburkholderia sp. HP33-1]
MIEATVHEYVRALNASDVDAILALFAADAVVEDPIGSDPRRGMGPIRDLYAGAVMAKVQLALDGPIRVAARQAAFAFTVSVEADGQKTKIQPIDVFHFNEEGKIAHMQAFFGPRNFIPA